MQEVNFLWWGEGALIEGEEEELEIGQPCEEEGRDAPQMDGGEGEREDGEDVEDGEEGEEPWEAFGDLGGYEVAIGQRCKG